jgi:hypothetical protein
MKRKKTLRIQRLMQLCNRLKDPRREWGNKRHELTDILVVALLAIICGCEEWEEIRDYTRTKMDWLRTFLSLKHGIPSKSTFRRVFCFCQAKNQPAIIIEKPATGAKKLSPSVVY